MESALCFISKCKPVKDPQFIAFNIPGMQGGIHRGFFVVEFEQCYVITTHLDPHAHQGSIRAKQIEAILAHMKNLSDKSVVFMGDLNIESQDIEACKLLKEHFPNFKEQDVLHPTAENATCFDNLPQVARNPRLAPQWTVLDHILVRSLSVQNIFEEKVCTFDLTQLSQALSDHHAVTLKLV